jgi:hypothetical protein
MDHRFDIDATAGPAREGVIGGSILLVRVRLFNGPGVADATPGPPVARPDVACDLRPREARRLAAQLLACAEQAEQITTQAGGWRR